MEEIDYFDAKIRRWRVGSSTFLAWPERGARLMNWNIGFPDGTFRDVIRWPELASSDEFAMVRGGNPILFPFCARTFDQGKINFWKDPKGTRRPMPMHGLARQGLFETTRIDQTGFTAKYSPDLESRKAYPYEYEFEVVYRFSEKECVVELRLSNFDSLAIPWSAGHHFYFNLPWLENTTFQDYEIRMPGHRATRQLANGALEELPKSKRIDLLSNPLLVDRIHYRLAKSAIQCVCLKDGSSIEIEIGTASQPDPEYALVTWTESADSTFYCLEPWMGPPNSPATGIGLHKVSPGETHAFSVSVRI